MARPRKDSECPTGKDRIKQAFWALYAGDAPRRMTVKDVCAEAGCNKTTFYYHYECIEDVLREIEEECIPFDAPVLIAPLMKNGEGVRFIAEYVSRHKERYERMCFLLGPSGDPAFAPLLKDVMMAQWEEALGFKVSSLSSEGKLVIDFVASGLLGVFSGAKERDMELSDMVATLGDVLLPNIDDMLNLR